VNKFSIPSILVATVLVAGIFAFMPVEQASTVHLSDTFKESIAATAGLVKVEVTGIDDSTGLSGFVTFERTGGAGAFSIDFLFICDQETNSSNGDIEQNFQFQIETSQTTGTGAKMLNSLTHPLEAGISGESGMEDGECYSILTETNFNADTGHTGSAFIGAAIQLVGDENNKIIVFMGHGGESSPGAFSSAPNDGATMVAYISGAAAGDISAVETEPPGE